MNKLLLILLFTMLAIVMGCSCYVVGFYNGASKAILFEQFMAANRNIHAINYIKIEKYNRAISLLTTELESNMNAINDINSDVSNPIELAKKYSKFKELIYCNSVKNINLANKKFKDFVNRYPDLKPNQNP